MPPREEVVAFSHGMALLTAVAGTLLGLTLALLATDGVMSFHALLFALACAASGYSVGLYPRKGVPQEH